MEIDWKGWLTIAVGAIGAYVRWRPKKQISTKELSFGIIQHALLMGAVKSIADRVGMTFLDVGVERVSRVVLSLMNTGQLEILAADFERPLVVKLRGVNRILATKVIRTSPSHLDPVLSYDRAEITIQPQLLNPGDFVTIEVLVDNASSVAAKLETRLVGVSTFPRLFPGKRPTPEWGGFVFWGGFTLGISALSVFQVMKGTYALPVFNLLFIGLGVVALVELVRETLQSRRARWMGDKTEDLAMGDKL